MTDKKYQKEYREKNKERLRLMRIENKDKRQEYLLENKEKHREYQHEYRIKNKLFSKIDLQNEIDKLNEEIARLREGLQFYANGNHVGTDDYDGFIVNDHGRHAKNVLGI